MPVLGMKLWIYSMAGAEIVVFTAMCIVTLVPTQASVYVLHPAHFYTLAFLEFFESLLHNLSVRNPFLS